MFRKEDSFASYVHKDYLTQKIKSFLFHGIVSILNVKVCYNSLVLVR